MKAWNKVRLLLFSILAVVLSITWVDNASAQFENKAMAVGDFMNVYAETGAQQEYWKSGYGNYWPAIVNSGGVLRAGALWFGVDSFLDADGKVWDKRVVHVGPRATGAGEFFPQGFTTTSKFEPPEVTVDGLPTFNTIVDNDAVDATLPADRMIETTVNTLIGATLTKRIYGWSNEYHDDYHIKEYIITNNTGNPYEEGGEVVPEQDLNGLYVNFQKRYTYSGVIVGSGWGANVMNDIVGDGMNDYGKDFNAVYTWLGNSLNAPYDPLGDPLWETNNVTNNIDADTSGRLGEPAFVGVVNLHADSAAGNTTPAQGQPSFMGRIDADDQLTSNNDAFNEPQMINEYEFMANGIYPGEENHAYLVDQDDDFTTAEGDPMLGKPGGWQQTFSYGPYDLAPGESIRFVIAEGANGLSMDMAIKVGRAWKESANHVEANADPTTPLTIDGTTLTKNEWWWSGQDSIFQMFDRAIAHYDAGLGSIPDPPRPPQTFDVVSGVDQIELSWTAYDDGPTRTGWEVYRTQNRYQGDVRDDWKYRKIATLGAGETSYNDVTSDDGHPQRGVNYFYYLVATGDPADNDGAGMTPVDTLRSSRYYAQTYSPASLKRGPGSGIEAARVVPNPFNLGSVDDIRWPDIQDKIGFLDIPGYCTIRIYTELGEHIRTIEHNDGSGDEYWDMMTYSQQLVVSGVYLAYIEETDENMNPTGNTVIRKIIIIR
ncbi:MAG: hypothetical protein GF372_09405 [Candidatus Marinimicrobia bacterium]|nr:hypothetical protein [Candidatus Neomarinimicrobiota bacterium]